MTCFRKRLSPVFLLLATLVPAGLGSAFAVPPHGPDLRLPSDTGVVTRVSDGDTLRVRFADGGQRRVRLIGVNAPELGDERPESALWAFLAARYALFHLRGRTVRLEYDETRLDDYGRTLAYVLTEDGELFNERLIRDGYARAFLRYPFRKDYRARFREAETDARRAGRGIWQTSDPPAIPAAAASANLGRVVGVRFDCATVSRERGFLFLRSKAKDFEALVPLDRREAFGDLSGRVGRRLIVTGFLEEFRGRPQIVLHFPGQLRFE